MKKDYPTILQTIGRRLHGAVLPARTRGGRKRTHAHHRRRGTPDVLQHQHAAHQRARPVHRLRRRKRALLRIRLTRGLRQVTRLAELDLGVRPWGTVDDDGTTLSNVAAADAFHTNQTKEITIGGKKVAFGNFDAAGWNCALPGTGNNGEETAWTVDGNMWAPDVIYNPVMEKWCQYLSLNGPTWNSCIILLTADRIEGPYVYQGPVVYTGFRNDTDERISFHKTDLELVIGPQASLPERYRQDNWGDFWPHAIDPLRVLRRRGTAVDVLRIMVGRHLHAATGREHRTARL